MKHSPYQTECIKQAVTLMRDYANDTSLSLSARETHIRKTAMRAIDMVLKNAEHYIKEGRS